MTLQMSSRPHCSRRRSLALGTFIALMASLTCGALAAAPASRQYVVPPKGKIPVAFVISDEAVTIDFGGPWEVFKDVFIPERGKTVDEQGAFRLYTVSDSRDPVTTSGGMRIIPDYTFDDVPMPAIVVIPAQEGRSTRMLSWIRKVSTQAQVLMSVCTGASVLKVILVKNRRLVRGDAVTSTFSGSIIRPRLG